MLGQGWIKIEPRILLGSAELARSHLGIAEQILQCSGGSHYDGLA